MSLSSSSSSSLSSIGSPTSSKTHAFFSSPFPTRPPSPMTKPVIYIIDTTNQQTPRPIDIQPSQLWKTPSPNIPNEPHPGYLISSSSNALSITSPPTPASLSPPQQIASTTLRLLRPLGHGTFSSVWLADDLSPVPLALRSRRSLRDLRRQASLTSSLKPKLPSLSLSLSRAGSLRTLRKRVPGTRPMSGTREKLDGRTMYLDERHGQMGTGPAISNADRKFETAHPRGVDLPLSLSRSSSASSSASSSFSRNRNVSLSISIEEPHRDGGLSRNGSKSGRGRSAKGRLVAVKMTLRGGASVGGSEEEREEREKEKERTRVAFVREVEVLRVSIGFFLFCLVGFVSPPCP
jgi:protein-serine/threonine kinase